ncbi:MAG TPA: hypothetical protein VH593_33680, partial [Ktedonobacteraceae bacterium]
MGSENLLRETNGGETSPHTSQDLPHFMTLVDPRSSLVYVDYLDSFSREAGAAWPLLLLLNFGPVHGAMVFLPSFFGGS